MKFLTFTDEEIDGDGEEEKVPSFESIVNGEDEDEEA